MTETVMPKEVCDTLKPEYVAPFVAFLVHESVPDNGALYEVGAGYIAKQRWNRSEGVQFDAEKLSPEEIKSKWAQVNQFEKGSTYPTSNQEMMAIIMNNHEAKQKAAATKATPAAAPSSGLKSENIFGMMATYLNQGLGKPLIPKVAAVFGFEIQGKKGGPIDLVYEIDLKSGQGHTKKGKPEKPDATFTMTDEDFEAVCMGKLNPQIAFMQGKMKIKGNMAKASKFTPDLFPPPTPENLAKFAPAKL
jgi:3-hydroxyacyl-CoA dehydrogenase/3a,7a,12a-trihydroxy-5b-cholest-24-enoyl-CoA hydratase